MQLKRKNMLHMQTIDKFGAFFTYILAKTRYEEKRLLPTPGVSFF